MTKEKANVLSKMKGMKKELRFALIIAVIILVIVVIVYAKTVVFNNKDGQVTTISKSSLEKVIEINELSTIDYTYNAIATVYDENDKKGEKIKYYVAYEGLVTAGIDFKKIEIVVDDTEKKVTITLPEIEIHDLTVNMGTMDCIFVDNKYNTEKVSQEAYTASKEDLKKRIEQDTELPQMAKENAIASVKALFTPWIEQIDEEYTVEVK